MTITLLEVAGANFRTDEASDSLNTAFMIRLGMRKRYLPARLAISRSLAISPLPDLDVDEMEPNKVIKGDTLFGAGASLALWTSLLAQRGGDPNLDLRRLVSLVGAHWRRGIRLLDDDWQKAGQDVANFVKRLVEVAGVPAVGPCPGEFGSNASAKTFSNGQLNVPIGEVGEDVASKERVVWTLNGQGGSPHCAIMGGVGSGKTRTAVAMLRSIWEQAAVPLLAFDFKGDLGTDASGGGYRIDEVFNATVLEPPRIPIPLDVLSVASTSDIDIAEAASRFRESFSRLKGSRLGDRQRTILHEAACLALGGERPCELHNIRDELARAYAEHEMREDGAVSTMQEICRFPLFQPTFSPADFFQRSWLIKLPPNVADDSRTIVVNLVLDSLDQHLNRLVDAECGTDGARGLRILCMIDEAHRILGSKLPSLSSLIRMSRSKGGAIMLISQSPDDFSGEDEEFLSEMGLVVAFATNAPPRNATRVLGRGTNLATLQMGQSYAKRRGDQVARKIKAWEAG